MRKLFVILVVSVLLMTALVPSVMAQRPHPSLDQVPVLKSPFDEGLAFGDLWIDLNPPFVGAVLPGGPPFIDDDEDLIRGGAVGDFQHGLPIGFPFHYMGGPAEAYDELGLSFGLHDRGYEEVYVALNGYIVFDTFRPNFEPNERPVAEFAGLGAHVFMVNAVPTADIPNNYIAPFFTDLTVSDNDFTEVKSVAFDCTNPCTESSTTECNDEPSEFASGPQGCGCPTNIEVQGHWVPCDVVTTPRPRGRLMYGTVGDEPYRKFVVTWENAKNVWSGDLATFQVQLWEAGNKILFLYNDFSTKADFEDPPHESAWRLFYGLVVGMEDWYGDIGVGQAYLPTFSFNTWFAANPFDDAEAMGWCVPAYDANACVGNVWQ